MVLEAATRAPVLIEDASTHAYDETALFHLINAVRENGSALLMTSGVSGQGWPVTSA
jgi:chromosomal replication initiation ATPase DnaA